MSSSTHPRTLRTVMPEYTKKTNRCIWHGDKRQYSDNLYEDCRIREVVQTYYKSHILLEYIVIIERSGQNILVVSIQFTDPKKMQLTKAGLERRLRKSIKSDIIVNIEQMNRENMIFSGVIEAIKAKMYEQPKSNIKRHMTRAAENTMRHNRGAVLGVSMKASGRFRGGTMTKKARYESGSVPFSTLGANILSKVSHLNLSFGVMSLGVSMCFKKYIPSKGRAS